MGEYIGLDVPLKETAVRFGATASEYGAANACQTQRLMQR